MENPKGHKGILQMSDQAICTYCGKAWDMNDIDPPECTEEPAPAMGTRVKSRWQSGYVGNLQNLPRDRESRLKRGQVPPSPTGRFQYGFDPAMHSLPVVPVDTRFLDEMLEKPVAYLIRDCGIAGFIVYAFGESQALGFAEKLLWDSVCVVTVMRLHSMDEYCTGRAPRVELNPSVIARANEISQYNVVSPLVFRNIVRGK